MCAVIGTETCEERTHTHTHTYPCILKIIQYKIYMKNKQIQGGSNMTGTDLYVKSQPPPSLLLRLEPVQSYLGVARVMSEQKVPRSVEQRIVIKFLVGENVPSAEQYGEETLFPILLL